MNRRFGKIIFCVAIALATGAFAHADELAVNSTPLPDNPYSQVVTRNIFGLNPPTVETNVAPEGAVKIAPSGIQDLLGKVQVLFKTTGGSGKNKEQFYMLGVNERQDGIEVKSIDQQNGIVTFDNHGLTQTLPLAATSGSTGSSPSPLPGPGGNNFSSPDNNNENRGGNGRGGFTRFGNRGGGFNRGNNGNNGNNMNGNGGSDNNGDSTLRTIPTRTYQPTAPQMTPEEVIIQTEKNHAAALDRGDPSAPLYPPTPLSGQY